MIMVTTSVKRSIMVLDYIRLIAGGQLDDTVPEGRRMISRSGCVY